MDLRLKFNEDEMNYDRYRPGYPDALYEDIYKYCSIGKLSNVLEIGIGTGQATEPFLKSGCNVSAIELGNRLSSFVALKYTTYKNINVINADFMDIDLPEESFDLVYSATAFHWLPEQAIDKVKKILKPNGCIVLFWNHPFPNRLNDKTNLASMGVYKKYRPFDKEQIEFSNENCRYYKDLLDDHGFTDVNCKLYHRIRKLSADEYIHLLNTYSDHRALSKDVKENFEKEMLAELKKVGSYINIYDTMDLYLARK